MTIPTPCFCDYNNRNNKPLSSKSLHVSIRPFYGGAREGTYPSRDACNSEQACRKLCIKWRMYVYWFLVLYNFIWWGCWDFLITQFIKYVGLRSCVFLAVESSVDKSELLWGDFSLVCSKSQIINKSSFYHYLYIFYLVFLDASGFDLDGFHTNRSNFLKRFGPRFLTKKKEIDECLLLW